MAAVVEAVLAVQPVLDHVGVRAGPHAHPGAAARALVDLVLPRAQRGIPGPLRLLEGHATGVNQLTGRVEDVDVSR
jgi:hypothetical protein